MSRIEAEWAVGAGASALGFVSKMPSGPGVLSEEAIARIAQRVPVPVLTVLLTSYQSARDIVRQQRRVRTSAIQIVDKIPIGEYRELRDELPGVRLIQAVHVLGEESIDEAASVAPHVDAILLDSGRPYLSVKELGGTGRRHDWALSSRIREAMEVPVFLAGGLRPDNILAAIEEVGPFGLDVCTGVRTDGKLDPSKLAAFMENAFG